MLKERTMEVRKTDIKGVLIIEPRVFKDQRGYFFESFSERDFEKQVDSLLVEEGILPEGGHIRFCQDNESCSSYGVMRGLHFQRPPFCQSKLVRWEPCSMSQWTSAREARRTGSMWLWN